MDLEVVRDQTTGIAGMRPEQARVIYDHIRSTRPLEALELGTAHGVSAAYIAAALHENGSGQLTTLDRESARYDPSPQDVLSRVGLRDLVTLHRSDDSSYNWFLKEQVQARSDDEGNCEPLYDFCYLDGAHDWTIDGLAVILVEKLLRPNGWLLLDDLSWTYADADLLPSEMQLSEAERSEPHVRHIFELLVKQSPAFTELKVQADLDWGWARKAPGQPRRLTIETTRSLGSELFIRGRDVVRRIRPKLRGTIESPRGD